MCSNSFLNPMRLVLMAASLLLMAGCEDDDDPKSLNVTGTWIYSNVTSRPLIQGDFEDGVFQLFQPESSVTGSMVSGTYASASGEIEGEWIHGSIQTNLITFHWYQGYGQGWGPNGFIYDYPFGYWVRWDGAVYGNIITGMTFYSHNEPRPFVLVRGKDRIDPRLP